MNDAPLLELNNVSRSFVVGGSLFHPRRLTAPYSESSASPAPARPRSHGSCWV